MVRLPFLLALLALALGLSAAPALANHESSGAPEWEEPYGDAGYGDPGADDVDADGDGFGEDPFQWEDEDRKSTRLNSSHANISYAVFCLKKKIDRNSTSL